MFWRQFPPIQTLILAPVMALLVLSHLQGQQVPASDLERLQAEIQAAPREEGKHRRCLVFSLASIFPLVFDEVLRMR